MERTVPSTASEEVELYLRTYYSLLRSSAEVQIRSLEEVHAGMNSLLHTAARRPEPDMTALIYTLLRLPACMLDVQRVVLGQSLDVFRHAGLDNIEQWELITAPARRRRCFYDGQDTLACFIASRSDIDDVIPLLTTYQIEINKIHRLLHPHLETRLLTDEHESEALAEAMKISMDDLERLRQIFGGEFQTILNKIAAEPRHLRVQLLSGSFSEYRRATNQWWEHIEQRFNSLKERPIYFISSNTHSVINLLSGFALNQRASLLSYLQQSQNLDLWETWQDIQQKRNEANQENFLYYVLKKYQGAFPATANLKRQHEQQVGIACIPSEYSFDVEAQIVELRCLQLAGIDPRLRDNGIDAQTLQETLGKSDALIYNIDYPLGLAAYNILSEIADQAGRVLGVYVIGKSASLNGISGDIMIPNVVHDEHSKNTFLFANCFASAEVAPYLQYGTVLDNQKAVSVRGTFLQNPRYMEVFYREGYTDIEMEAGPYLSAIYEMYRPQRHPMDEIVNLYGLPFDLGIIHYVADTPMSKGRNLGAGSLSYYGMDSTYAATVATLRRIFSLEIKRQKGGG